MKILDEIIDLGVDSSGPLPVLLRKCLLLAHTLNFEHDAPPPTARSLGRGEWIGAAAAKLGASAVKLGGNVAEALITQWLRQYGSLAASVASASAVKRSARYL